MGKISSPSISCSSLPVGLLADVWSPSSSEVGNKLLLNALGLKIKHVFIVPIIIKSTLEIIITPDVRPGWGRLCLPHHSSALLRSLKSNCGRLRASSKAPM